MPSVLHMEDSLTYDFRLTDSPDGANASNSNNATSQDISVTSSDANITSSEMDVTPIPSDDLSGSKSLRNDSNMSDGYLIGGCVIMILAKKKVIVYSHFL